MLRYVFAASATAHDAQPLLFRDGFVPRLGRVARVAEELEVVHGVAAAVCEWLDVVNLIELIHKDVARPASPPGPGGNAALGEGADVAWHGCVFVAWLPAC